MTGIEIFCGIALASLLVYYYLIGPYNFWKKQGVPGPKPIPLFGNAAPLLFSKETMVVFLSSIYKKYKNCPMVGIFINRQPALVVNDPELIKTVLIKDFTKFSDRAFEYNEVAEPLSIHLFALDSKRWRPVRRCLSPVFTSGKLKELFTLILECSNNLNNYLETLLATSDEVDFRELAARYTTDVIGSCVFGVNMNAMSAEGSEFHVIGQKFTSYKYIKLIRFRLREYFPWIYTMLGYVIPYPVGNDAFKKRVLEMIDHRIKNNIIKKDFMNTLVDLKMHPDKLQDIELTDNLLVGQALVFFIAGFETSSSTISNALYELAQHQDIQDKLREEIKEHEKMNNGEWHYENIKIMPILDGVFKETLRKYSPVAIMRKTIEDYTFEDSKIWVPKGTRVFIPANGVHYDPDIYPNPEVFDINRFTQDEVSKRHPMHFLPFGDGPRNCIGARFAIYQTKVGLIRILRKYKVDVCNNTVIPYVINQRAFLLAPKHLITLKVTKLEDS
ncbi:cytochrome P450 6A1-like [Nomia melanderi]|uniref:cytochrome P450 6A1-like n=1 Tax=Nomia melanderi TaxID=2448451 RepID=UPI003FCD9288